MLSDFFHINIECVVFESILWDISTHWCSQYFFFHSEQLICHELKPCSTQFSSGILRVWGRERVPALVSSWQFGSLADGLSAHNWLNPLRLPSHCSTDLYNVIWLLTNKNGLILQNSQMLMIFSLKVSSNNWGQDATFPNQPEMSIMFQKKVKKKTNKLDSDFWWLTPPASPASPHPRQDIEN